MFGDLIYEQGDYREWLLADEQGVRVVFCTSGITTKLYRVEWAEPDGYGCNQAVYNLLNAIEAFQKIVQQVQTQPTTHSQAPHTEDKNQEQQLHTTRRNTMPEDEKITEAALKQLVENNGQVYSEQSDEGGEMWVSASGIQLGTRKALILMTREQAEKRIRYATATHA